MKHSKEQIYSTLNNILESEVFRSSPRSQFFLKYVVTETVEGRANRINGTTIAQDVFEKDADFDSTLTTVVRVTARRLRSMLRDYYIAYPNQDPLVLTMPKGSYRIEFQAIRDIPSAPHQDEAQAPQLDSMSRDEMARDERKPLFSYLVSAVVVFVLGFGTFKVLTADKSSEDKFNLPLSERAQAPTSPRAFAISDYPMIAVSPFENHTGEKNYCFLETTLQKKLVEDLSRFQIVRPVVYGKTYEALIQENDKNQGPYKYAISGLILSMEPELDLYIKLFDLETTSVVYENRITRSPKSSNYFDSLSQIVTDLSGDFAGPEGVIVQDNLTFIETQIERGTGELSNLKSFECLIMTEKLFDDPLPSPSKYEAVYTCLNTLLEQDPDNPLLLANFGGVTYLGAKSSPKVHDARSINPDINTEDGLNMVRRAASLAPKNGAVQNFLALTLHMDNGSAQEILKHAKLAYTANPGDPNIIARLSTSLADVGQWDRALTLAKEAQNRTPNAPAQYYHTDFAWALINDDKEGMQKTANIIAQRGSYYDFVFMFMAAVANDDAAVVAELRPRVVLVDAEIKLNFGNEGIILAFKQANRNAEAISKARELFIKAGVFPEIE